MEKVAFEGKSEGSGSLPGMLLRKRLFEPLTKSVAERRSDGGAINAHV
jgi:hypothetical protein